MSSVLKIDTQGACILCKRSKNCLLLEEATEKDTLSMATALKMFLRYLEVDVTKLSPFSALLQTINGDNVDLSVELCEDCSSATNDLLHLFNEMEGLRLKVDLRVRQIHEFIENGKNDSEERAGESVTPIASINDLISSRLAESLRKEILEKVCLKVKLSLPTVIVDNSRTEDVQGHSLSSHPPARLEQEVNVTEGPVQLTENPIVSNKPPPEGTNANCGNELLVSSNQDESSSTDEINSTEPAESVAKSEQIHISLSKCVYCEKWFSQQTNLQAHQLLNHTLAVLSDQGSLPSHISQTKLETALEGIVTQMKSRAAKCPLCKRSGFQSEHHVRKHLLLRHMSYFVKQAEREYEVRPPQSRPPQPDKVEVNNNHQQQMRRKGPAHSADSAKSTTIYRTCIYCGKRLHTRSGIRKHQLRDHMMSVFQDIIPNSVSEGMMKAALDGIRNSAPTTFSGPDLGRKFQCKFCSREVCNLKLHLLSEHVEEVIREASSREVHQSSSSLGEERPGQLSLKSRWQHISPSPVVVPSSSSSSSAHLSALSNKYKCGVCGEFVATIFELKLHFSKKHSRPVKPWRCEHCQGDFTTWKVLRVHLLHSHPVAYFKDSLPVGTSHQEFTDAVSTIVRKSKVKLNRNVSRDTRLTLQSYVLECLHCRKRLDKMYQLRMHVSRCHLPEVIDALRELRNQRTESVRQ